MTLLMDSTSLGVLQIVEVPVGRARGVEPFVGADDGCPVSVEPDDLVQLGEEGQAVRQEEDDAVAAEPAQVVENHLFRRHVDGGERVVENEERPRMEQGPGQGDAGLLAAGQALAAFADRRLGPGREGGAVLVHADHFQDSADIARQAEADVLFDGSCKEFRVVAAIADDAVRCRMAVAQFLGAEENLAAVGIFTEKGLAQRRFAAGHGPGDADEGAGLGGKGQVPENRVGAAGIGKGQVADRQFRRRRWRYGLAKLGSRLEMGLDALP